MLNILKRREDRPAARPVEWDPFAVMRDLVRMDPFGIAPLPPRFLAYQPDFDVKEVKDAYVVKADLPGLLEKDLEITLTGNRLSITGKREDEKHEENETYFAFERSFGAFTRSFTLPDGADWEHIAAQLKEGVLTLVIPKKPEVVPKKIALGEGKAPM
jgi:HSP20 family protein